MAIRYYDFIVDGNTMHIFRERDMPDGTIDTEKLSYPITTYSIRAGEYGLDPVADKDKIWHIILHEIEALSDMQHPPLVTAATLEEATQQTLDLCDMVKDAYEFVEVAARRGVVDNSQPVLDMAHNGVVIDDQLITLFRIKTKEAVFQERDNMALEASDTRTFAQKTKSAMLDSIRTREGV